MANVSFEELNSTLNSILLKTGFTESESKLCANIFARSTADGYHSHGVNRFSELLKTITGGFVKIGLEPKRELSLGSFERWDGQLAAGPLTAHFSMNRAIELAKEFGMGCVALNNGSHWMRGGSYGWQAAEAGCIGICFTNTEPNMPSWGSKQANTGNNPLVIAVPHQSGNIVLDMSMSQFSYGKMWQLAMEEKELPFEGGYNLEGVLTKNPKDITDSRRLLPTGYWKGSGLSILLDLISTLLSSGRSTAKIGEMEVEYGLSQVFICFDAKQMNHETRHKALVDEILKFVTSATPIDENGTIEYPGSQTLKRRKKSMTDGMEINDEVWSKLTAML